MSKPTWDDTLEVEAPTWDDTIEPSEVSKTESLARGTAQGATMGFADELAGAAQGMWNDAKALFTGGDANQGAKPTFDEFGNVINSVELGGVYRDARDEYRASDAAARKANPKTFMAGEIGGGLVTAAIPGAGTVKGASLIGGASGLGMSEAEDLVGTAKDTAIGAGLGAAAGDAVPKVIDAGKKDAGWAGKKVGNIGFGVGEEATEAYLKNPGAVKNAKPLKEVADAFLDKVDDVRGDTSMQSGKSFETLGQHYHDIATVTDPLVESANKIRELGIIGKDRKNAVKFLEGIADDVFELANSGKIGLDKGKQTLSVLDAEIKKLTKREADTQTIKALTEARRNLDEVLKQISPEYKSQMSKLAEDTKAAAGIANKFRTEGGAEKMLQRVSRGKDRYTKDALEAFDERFGTEFTQDLENAALKNQFTRETTNGSRRTLLGTMVGGAIGSLGGGPVGAAVGGAGGAAAGAAIDKVGGRIWQAVLDGTMKAGPWVKVLEDAARRGPAAVGVTHMVLMKNNPEYRKAVEESAP